MTKHGKPDPVPPPGTQAKPKPESPSGGIGFDERGNSVWKWRSDVDTQEVKALQESAELSFSIEEETPKHSTPHGHDPYSSAAPPPRPLERKTSAPPTPEKKPQRRTLDDMRRLSEEIKRQRELKKPT